MTRREELLVWENNEEDNVNDEYDRVEDEKQENDVRLRDGIEKYETL
jgi:hypothetical protein